MFFLIDKPVGWSSFKVVYKLRKVLGIKKVGHAGTLDPLASGLLILACGKSTKLLSHFLNMRKTYLVTAIFGVSSDTYDGEGKIEIFAKAQSPSRENVERLLSEFTGDILQMPPSFSAIKVNGKKAYEIARAGKKVDLSSRKVNVGSFEIINWKSEFVFRNHSIPKVDFRIECSKGTYVRSLIHDLGQTLSCGALVYALRRTKIGNFSVNDPRMVKGEMLDKEPELFLKNFNKYEIREIK